MMPSVSVVAPDAMLFEAIDVVFPHHLLRAADEPVDVAWRLHAAVDAAVFGLGLVWAPEPRRRRMRHPIVAVMDITRLVFIDKATQIEHYAQTVLMRLLDEFLQHFRIVWNVAACVFRPIHVQMKDVGVADFLEVVEFVHAIRNVVWIEHAAWPD